MAQLVPLPAPTPFRVFRGLVVLAFFHVAAAAIDINVYFPQTQLTAFHWPWSLKMLQCDAALLCILFLNCKKSPPLFWMLAPVLLSSLTLGFILSRWVEYGGLATGDFPGSVSSTGYLCLLLTFLLLPLLGGAYWLLGRRERRPWHWLLASGLLLLAVAKIYFASTVFGFTSTRVHSYWIYGAWLRLLVTVIAAILCSSSIALAAWTFDRFHRAGAWRLLPSLICVAAAMASAPYFVIYVYIWIVTRGFSGAGRIPISQFQTEAWTAASAFANDLLVVALTGLLMYLLTACFWLTGAGSFLNTASDELAQRPAALPLPKLSSEDRRFQFWRLTGAGLFISALSLACGFYDWITPIQVGRFADRGILFEVLLMAPLGLWSAQMAANALFLECRIWNFWKRLLLILAWAEITLLAFWGQIALSHSLRWQPSDYVGALFHIVLGALLLALLGRLIKKQTSAALHWSCIDSEADPASSRGKFSLSLSDIICLVAVSAAVIYPISVVFALEGGWSSRSLLQDFLLTSYWPLATGAAAYFALRAALTDGKQALTAFTLSLLCLLISTASDQLILAFIFDELFFGVRWSVGMMAFPGLFLGVSFTSIALRHLGFRITDLRTAPSLAIEAAIRQSDYGPTSAEDRGVLATTAKEPSPWD